MKPESIEIESGLSLRLRTATQTAHAAAEGGSITKKIFTGAVSEQEYWLYLWALNHIYTALEEALEEHKRHLAVSAIYFPQLFRRESLIHDLKTWADFKNDVPLKLKTEVENYIHHLKKISEENPLLLISHAYVRYLGDLSGGQIFKKTLSQKFPLSDGLNFYSFPLISNPADMKTLYRKQLDTVGQKHPDSVLALEKEAVLAFEYNGKIFSTFT